mmetsp:Transcript_116802/g.330463  ORF Transcript_116802/g.330463 Transcript_116802/m.330463 type:complete len:207 (+) Transcript_116802:1467-2087(+)
MTLPRARSRWRSQRPPPTPPTSPLRRLRPQWLRPLHSSQVHLWVMSGPSAPLRPLDCRHKPSNCSALSGACSRGGCKSRTSWRACSRCCSTLRKASLSLPPLVRRRAPMAMATQSPLQLLSLTPARLRPTKTATANPPPRQRVKRGRVVTAARSATHPPPAHPPLTRVPALTQVVPPPLMAIPPATPLVPPATTEAPTAALSTSLA